MGGTSWIPNIVDAQSLGTDLVRAGTVERRVVAVLRIERRFILGDLWIWGP